VRDLPSTIFRCCDRRPAHRRQLRPLPLRLRCRGAAGQTTLARNSTRLSSAPSAGLQIIRPSGTARGAAASSRRCSSARVDPAKKKRRLEAPLFVRVHLFRGSLRESALVTRGSVLVYQSLPRRSIEQFDRCQLVFRGPRRRCALQRGTQRGALGAVPNRGGARFPHVLFR
jgi:hypothetical protein